MQSWQQEVLKYFDQGIFIPVTGGSLADSYELRTNQEHYFVKYYDPATISDPRVAWRETQALNELQKWGWPVPRVIQSQESFMVLAWIEHGSSLQQEAAGEILGDTLGKVHNRPADSFSLPWGNSIGVLQNPSETYRQGGDFYWFVRFHPLLEALIPHYPALREIIRWEKPIRNFLNRSIHHPTLVHGDLWSGNFLWNKDAVPYVVDPAGYFGDPVSDIAFSELFGSFPRTFYDHYWTAFGQDIYYHRKKPLYQFYHALVHLKLFGHSYWNLTQRLGDQIFHDPSFQV